MSARSLSTLVCLLGALAQGCGAVSEDATAGGVPVAASEPGVPGSLVLVTPNAPLVLVTGATAEVTVLLLDVAGQPRPQELVSFSVLGSPKTMGASLSADVVATDSAGYATVRLRAGSTENDFELRASAGSATLTVAVQVSGSEQLTALIGTQYGGQRPIASRTLTLVAGATCAQLLSEQGKQNLRSATTSVLFESLERAKFNLQPDQAYAVLAWGSDETNSRLASGCDELDARAATGAMSEAQQSFDIVLHDNPLELTTRSYDQLLTLNLAKPLEQLAPAAREAVRVRLPAGAAAFYLSLLDAAVPAFANEAGRAARENELAVALQTASAGPLVFADALSNVTVLQSAEASLAGTLNMVQGGAMPSFQASRLFARAPDGSAKEIALDVPTLSKQAVVSGSYDAGRAALQLGSLSLQIGLGSYATRVLNQLGSATVMPTLLPQSHGCTELGALLTARPSAAVSAKDAVDYCQAGVASLVNDIAAAWLALDAERPLIVLSGPLPVHDRDGDGYVDDVGPSALSGSWDTALTAAADGSVKGTMRVPPATAL